MSQISTQIKDAGPKLIPFFKTVAIYFVTFIPQDNPGMAAAFIKCMPIVCLMIFVGWQGQQLEDKYKSYWQKIMLGLFFSCIGDYFLLWAEEIWFIIGMIAFSAGHISYMSAFGFKPLNIPAAVSTYAAATLAILVLYPGLNGVMLLGVPLYTYLLMTMVWRAIVRVQPKKGLVSWSRIATSIGAISFALSDLLIGLSMFNKMQIPHFQAAVMSTYYLAQFGIALSVLDVSMDDVKVKSN